MQTPFFVACPLCGTTRTNQLVQFPEITFVTCHTCGLVYKSHQDIAQPADYNAGYFRYGKARYLRRFGHRVRKGRRQLLAALEFIPTARRVLDVGCSAGYMLHAAETLGLEAVGVDLSEFAVSMCRERGLRAEVGEMAAMPFADASFDIVTAKHTLEHVPNPQAALREVWRVLRPGGAAFLIVPDATFWKRYVLPRRGSYFRPDRAGWQHHVYFAAAHLRQLALQCGFIPRLSGKAVYRQRLAEGPNVLWERLRFAALRAGTALAAHLHLRREIQLIACRPSIGGHY